MKFLVILILNFKTENSIKNIFYKKKKRLIKKDLLFFPKEDVGSLTLKEIKNIHFLLLKSHSPLTLSV